LTESDYYSKRQLTFFVFMKNLVRIILAALLPAVPVQMVRGQIYVACQGSNSIKAFSANGVPIGSGDLVSGLSAPNGIVLVGKNLFVTNNTGTSIGAYSISGDTVNANFSSIGLGGYGITTNGTALWVSNVNQDTINSYSTETGLPVSAPPLVSGLNKPRGVAVSGNVLYVADTDISGIKSLDATTGSPIASSRLGFDEPRGIAVSGNRVYVSNFGNNTIGVYDGTTCNPINASFISGLGGPIGLKVKGNTLYVAEAAAGRISTYDAKTGAVINANLITLLNNPYDMAITPDPVVVPKPIVKLIGKKNLSTKKSSIVIKGTATSATRVEIRVRKKSYRPARGTSSWKYTVPLVRGKNTVRIRAENSAGVYSAPVKVVVKRK
jgi:hypothetical protein